ncbi:helix-turn-helix domain-containing protein [Aquibacillus albus]|uniref:Uncharacterized protein YpbB n=1 Tax=Aquibacillus albus TaxID=1168171 RepID=A0ABS2MV71_9BACI|nr:uncharacterized protein YpbB [Aquibacillus albus]
MFKDVVLDCIYKLNGERSASAIYHLLTGKRSSQTLQDARIYHLKNYFGILKSLNRSKFLECINQLNNNDFIIVEENNYVILTERGFSYLKKISNQEQLSQFSGLNYERITNIFNSRLQLFIQTITNVHSNNYSFLAISDDKSVQIWVKKLFNNKQNEIDKWIYGIYSELFAILSTMSQMEASVFVDRLTGFNKIGLSKMQLAKKYKQSYEDIELMLVLIIHKMLNQLIYKKQNSEFLIIFFDDLLQESFVTDSATKTYQLLKQGFGIDEICKIRKLKESTIQDHLVEIAYVDPFFDTQVFLPDEEERDITHIVEKYQTRRLKDINGYLDHKYSYFKIRLALAAIQHNGGTKKEENV